MADTGLKAAKEGYISKKSPSSTALDFASLREIGIETIQKYAGKKWTDYNVHDPGVTVLEVLAYAITELGLKANSPIEDILASGNGDYIDLYKPSEILPSLPVTAIDFRKLLIDQPHIRNAWITKHTSGTETDIFYDETTKSLSYSSGTKVKLSGFSDVLLEFEDSSLNTNLLKDVITAASMRVYNLEIVFPYWDEIDSKELYDLEIQAVNVQTVPGTGGTTGVQELKLQDEGEGNYFAVIELTYVGGFTEDFGIHIQVSPEISDPADKAELVDFVDSSNPGAIVELLSDISSESLIQRFVEKANLSKNIIRQVRSFMSNYRNLSEDVFAFKTVRTQEIALNTDIDLMLGADAETVLAELFFVVNRFITPLIKFKSYSDMIAGGNTVEQVFEGPALINGFLESDDLTLGERTDLQTEELIFYTSDLFNKIKSLNDTKLEDNNHIIDLRNFSLSNYINNQIVTREARNCLKLSLSKTYKPKLSILKSDIRIFKEGIGVDFNINTVISKFNQLVSEELSGLKTYPTDVLDIPSGENTDISGFNTIQNDFPLTYGIGASGLPVEADEERKAQAKQLKEYLLLFEQIYWNFVAQLNNIKELFSYNTSIQRTYFYQLFSDIPLLNELITTTYNTDLQDIIEVDNSETQLKRRNKFLNHLVARFGEYNENFQLLFLESSAILEKKLIDLKRNILIDYQLISSNRFKAFNYSLTHTDNSPDVWDTDNVSGYEKRVCHLLGLQDCRRRHLYNPVLTYFEFYQETDTDSIDEQRFRLVDADNNILLSSTTKYTDENIMLQEIDSVIRFGTSRDNYEIITGTDKAYYFRLVDDTKEIIARRIEPFETMTEIEDAIDEVIDFIGFAYIGEGFHVIEHILLRPLIRGTSDAASHSFLPVFFNNDDKIIYKDPYSFQMTVIIPSGYIRDFTDANSEFVEITGLERFRNKDFRRILERTLRDESPAHTLLHIISLDVDSGSTTGDTPSLNNFERVYRLWLEATADPASDTTQILNTQRDLIAVMQKIYNPD